MNGSLCGSNARLAEGSDTRLAGQHQPAVVLRLDHVVTARTRHLQQHRIAAEVVLLHMYECSRLSTGQGEVYG